VFYRVRHIKVAPPPPLGVFGSFLNNGLKFKCEILYTYVDNIIIRKYWCKHDLTVENSLEIISIAALPAPSDFSALKNFCTKTRARKPFRSFRMTMQLSVYF